MGSAFYVYVMFRPDGRPCYVGKGSGERYRLMSRRYNRHLARIIAEAGGKIESAKVAVHLSESEAHEYERLLIGALGRERFGGILVNDTDGGDGISGYVATDELRAQQSATRKGRKRSPEACAKQSAARKGVPHSPEHTAKIAAAHRGMKRSEETKAKLRAAAKIRWAKPEERAKISRAKKGKPIGKRLEPKGVPLPLGILPG
jgi:NUMOD3 motif